MFVHRALIAVIFLFLGTPILAQIDVNFVPVPTAKPSTPMIKISDLIIRKVTPLPQPQDSDFLAKDESENVLHTNFKASAVSLDFIFSNFQNAIDRKLKIATSGGIVSLDSDSADFLSAVQTVTADLNKMEFDSVDLFWYIPLHEFEPDQEKSNSKSTIKLPGASLSEKIDFNNLRIKSQSAEVSSSVVEALKPLTPPQLTDAGIVALGFPIFASPHYEFPESWKTRLPNFIKLIRRFDLTQLPNWKADRDSIFQNAAQFFFNLEALLHKGGAPIDTQWQMDEVGANRDENKFKEIQSLRLGCNEASKSN